ncbi:hypothetical protein ACFX15_027501 [Malus domestica]
MSWKTLKHPGSRRIKKAFFVLRSSFFQDQAPTALEESVLRSSFFQDQAPDGPWINNINKSTHPTVLQDQAQKPLKIHPRKSTFKDQAHGLLKKLPTGNFVFTNWHARWDNLYLSSLSPFKKFKHTSKINGIKQRTSRSHKGKKPEHFRHERSIHWRHNHSSTCHFKVGAAKGAMGASKARVRHQPDLAGGTEA